MSGDYTYISVLEHCRKGKINNNLNAFNLGVTGNSQSYLKSVSYLCVCFTKELKSFKVILGLP